ncbi:GntR family transcriptional regulator [Jannaschia pohangensis]|uniref:Transcriptional regulator, GntR family n=1 Tax=Jannaschia pohangensis TaxID=390807 RepID=A0A1I3UJR2_9RHOB|nr:GntR family transcriptional regulator [Jannaschia pohangensis]SFJ82953.1 transcriptional regulator, GntR family [Jannaschia pohangensis]
MQDSLAADLENDIIFGRYPPGTRIVEDRVMERYDAKRHAVRNAFAVLEKRGLLVHRPNRGVEVVDFTPEQVDSLYDVRILLETAAAERTALPCPSDIAARLLDVAHRHKAAVANKDFREVFRLNQEFHDIQFSCCENDILAELVRAHARTAQPIRVVKYEDDAHMARVVEQHFEIIKAMQGTSTEALVRAVRAHLPASANAYRVLFERKFGPSAAAE